MTARHVSSAARVEAALTEAMAFLSREQLPSGQFGASIRSRNVAGAESPGPEWRPDALTFVTAHVTASIASCPGLADAMISKATGFLRGEAVHGGLWRFWNKDHRLHRRIPPDVDDTACISDVLERFGGGAPPNKHLLLLNRDRHGRFHTWILPRFRVTWNTRYWRAVLDDLSYERSILFWRNSGANRDDVQPVVNANALLYFGDVPEMRPVISWLLSVAQSGNEDSDKYYNDAFAFYYAVSRCWNRGLKQLEPARAVFNERMTGSDPRYSLDRANVLQAAVAISSLLNFDLGSANIERSIDLILESQHEDGGWEALPFFYDGKPVPELEWGSRELTTGFCVEALARFKGWGAARARA